MTQLLGEWGKVKGLSRWGLARRYPPRPHPSALGWGVFAAALPPANPVGCYLGGMTNVAPAGSGA